MTIPTSPPVGALLGANLTLPCLVSLTHPPPAPVTNGRHAVLSLPRVKWSLLVNNEEMEILVARGDRVRVSEDYRGRASLLSYARSPADLTLHLQGLRRSDSGLYRCEVQQGLEAASDVALVKVKGQSIILGSRSCWFSSGSEDPADLSFFCPPQGWCSTTAMRTDATPSPSSGPDPPAGPSGLGWRLQTSCWRPTAAPTGVTPAGCRTAPSGDPPTHLAAEGGGGAALTLRCSGAQVSRSGLLR